MYRDKIPDMKKCVAPLWLFSALTLLSGCSELPDAVEKRGPRVELSPAREVLMGERVSVRLAGLAPGEEVELVATTSLHGRPHRSSASFVVGPDGVVDLSEQAPIAGSYTGADALGILWSMERVESEADVPRSLEDVNEVLFELVRGDVVVAEQELRQVIRATDVEVSDVRDDGLVGAFASPTGGPPRPAVLLVGGSSGGIEWQALMARLLASRGYAALGLAYFDMDELPEHLDEVPLEYFERALAWLRARPDVDSDRIAVCGVSKGGELALLLGATYPEVRAVVAFVPSSVVFQSIHPTWHATSSWSLQGTGLPFVPYDSATARSGADLLEIYKASLRDEDRVNASAIPVENTNGPILLFSGGDDSIWPSAAMSEQVIARLERHGHPYPYVHQPHPLAGHSIARPVIVGSATMTRNGGTPSANAEATLEGWQRLLAFLNEHFGEAAGGE